MTIKHSAPEPIRDRLVPLDDGSFCFDCHPGVPCFTECCRELNLVLTPYDILRLKNCLELHAEAFLDRYTEVRPNEQNGLPMVYLLMNDDPRRTCPFVSPRGCRVYAHRPSACRTYPLARASRTHAVHGAVLEKYYLLREDHCQGFAENRRWSVKQWVSGQGLPPYHEMNNHWMEIATDRRIQGGLNDKQLQMFYLASYDLDRFRKFIFSGRFFDLFVVSDREREQLEQDQEALLRFAFRWLRFSLFHEPVLELKSAPGR